MVENPRKTPKFWARATHIAANYFRFSATSGQEAENKVHIYLYNCDSVMA